MLELRDVTEHFPIRNAIGRRVGWLRAVDGVSLRVDPKTILSVGESGCGKSTLAKTINGVYRLTSGEVVLNRREVGRLPEPEWRRLRKDVQYVYQDPGRQRWSRDAARCRKLHFDDVKVKVFRARLSGRVSFRGTAALASGADARVGPRTRRASRQDSMRRNGLVSEKRRRLVVERALRPACPSPRRDRGCPWNHPTPHERRSSRPVHARASGRRARTS